MDENIADVSIDLKTKQIVKVAFHHNLRFKCRKCAIFCCRLGGPKLTKTDIARLNEIGYEENAFLNSTPNSKFKGSLMVGDLKAVKDGSCIFLRLGQMNEFCECSIYNFRPALCRLYPFDFEKIGPNSFTLKFIPCCNGLNVEDGDPVNEDFITKYLLDELMDLI